MRVSVLMFAIALLASACSRPGEKRCTQVCEHFLDLYLADKYADKRASAADEDARAAVEAEIAAERKDRREKEEFGFEACINRCNRRSRATVADCVMDAKTLKAARACDAEEGCQVTMGAGRDTLGSGIVVFLGLFWLIRHRRGR